MREKLFEKKCHIRTSCTNPLIYQRLFYGTGVFQVY